MMSSIQISDRQHSTMSVNSYSFVTAWKIEASLSEVWNVICDVEDLPNWWKALVRVKILDYGDANGNNFITEQTWRGILPYKLTLISQTTSVERFKSIEIVASGDTEGNGKWTFSEAAGIVRIQYDWNVRTTQKALSLLAFAVKPLLA